MPSGTQNKIFQMAFQILHSKILSTDTTTTNQSHRSQLRLSHGSTGIAPAPYDQGNVEKNRQRRSLALPKRLAQAGGRPFA